MAMKNRPSATSTTVAGRLHKVRAPSAAAGAPGSEYANTARQSISRHQANTFEMFPTMAATAMIGTACFGPYV